MQFKIISKHAGKALDICQDKKNKGKAIIWDYWGGGNQKFQMQQHGLESCIKIVGTNKYLTVENGQEQNGASIIQQDRRDDKTQRFRIQQISPGSNEYVIYTFCGKVLDCYECSKKNGTTVMQYEFNKGDNQIWMIQKA